MRKLFSFIVFLFVAAFTVNGAFAASVSADFRWVALTNGDGSFTTYDTALDSVGNLVTTGWFGGSVVVNGKTYESNGDLDIFVAKYNHKGKLIFFKTFGGVGADTANNVLIGSNDNIFVLGSFSDKIAFEDKILESAGETDIFVAKFNSRGTHIYSTSDGGHFYESVNTAVIDGDDNLIVSGSFVSKAGFGDFILENETGYLNPFIGKYDSKGNALWFKQVQGDNSYRLTVDHKGNIFLMGYFGDKVSIGEDAELTSSSPEIPTPYFAKIDPSGKVVWLKKSDIEGNASSSSLAVNNKNEIILLGYLDGAFFLAKLDSDEGFTYDFDALLFGEEYEFVNIADFKLDNSGNAYIALNAYGESGLWWVNGLVLKYDTDGDQVWIKKIVGSNDQYANQLEIFQNEVLVVGGFFFEAVFGEETFVFENGSRDKFQTFIAKIKEY